MIDVPIVRVGNVQTSQYPDGSPRPSLGGKLVAGPPTTETVPRADADQVVRVGRRKLRTSDFPPIVLSAGVPQVFEPRRAFLRFESAHSVAADWGRAWFGSPLEPDSNGLSPYPNAGLFVALCGVEQGKRFLFGLDIYLGSNFWVTAPGEPAPKVSMQVQVRATDHIIQYQIPWFGLQRLWWATDISSNGEIWSFISNAPGGAAGWVSWNCEIRDIS